MALSVAFVDRSGYRLYQGILLNALAPNFELPVLMTEIPKEVSKGEKIYVEYEHQHSRMKFESSLLRLRQQENVIYIRKPTLIEKKIVRETRRMSVNEQMRYVIWPHPEGDSNMFAANIFDISEVGAKISAETNLKEHTILIIDTKIQAFGLPLHLNCHAVVIWCRKNENPPVNQYNFTAGIRFTTISAEDKRILKDAVRQASAQPA